MRKIPVLLLVSLLSGCAAMSGWFIAPATQAVLAEGCKAAAADDNAHNMILNQTLGVIPQAAPFLVGINDAHVALQSAYAKCVSDATRIANGGAE